MEIADLDEGMEKKRLATEKCSFLEAEPQVYELGVSICERGGSMPVN